MSDETRNYIRDIVWKLLLREPGDTSYLAFVRDACLDEGEVDIFTLNHDTLMETFLAQHGIELCDGFTKPVNEVRYFDRAQFDSCNSVRFVKLHGSLSWFEFDQDDRLVAGIPLGSDVLHRKDPAGSDQVTLRGRPLILAGTGNKPLEYQVGVFGELHHQFYRRIRETRHLAVVGYGFGDRGINQRVFDWIFGSHEARMVIAHPNPEGLKSQGRWEVREYWDGLEARGKIRFIVRAAEELTWNEIRAEFDDN
ncbi:MAG: SIR2 family protein [Dehalococcoidia bacterium]